MSRRKGVLEQVREFSEGCKTLEMMTKEEVIKSYQEQVDVLQELTRDLVIQRDKYRALHEYQEELIEKLIGTSD